MNRGRLRTGGDFLLVIPCFSESKRLPDFLMSLITRLSEAPFTTQILVVDDGSPNREQLLLKKLVRPFNKGTLKILSPEFLPKNTGKGPAVLHGWRINQGNQWLAFVDADGAISASEVDRILHHIFSRGYERKAYFAVRSPQAGRPIERTMSRGVAGKIFSTLARTLLQSDLEDSQCGFKIMPTAVFQKIEDQLEGLGFCFDLELYTSLRRAHVPVEELPIAWKDQSGGHVDLIAHSPRMLWDLLRLRYSTQFRFHNSIQEPRTA